MSASAQALLTTALPEDQFPVRRGKVRDIYDLGDRLLMVSTDRISAFDWVLPTGIPDKGRVLTQISAYWFDALREPNHLITGDVSKMQLPSSIDLAPLEGRSMLVKKTDVVPIECVVRGYLIGSGWKEYQASSSVCGIKLPPGIVQAQQLEEPIFTPATKAEEGHDDERHPADDQDLPELAAHIIRDLGVDLAPNLGAELALMRQKIGQPGDQAVLILDQEEDQHRHQDHIDDHGENRDHR